MEPELLMAHTQSTFLMAVLSMSNTMPATMMDMLLMYLMKELLPILMLFILWLTLLPILQLFLIQLPMLLLTQLLLLIQLFIQLLLDMVLLILDRECNFCNVHFIHLFIYLFLNL